MVVYNNKKIRINCTETHVWIRGMTITLHMRVRVFDTRVFPAHWPDGYAMLMSPNKGNTAVMAATARVIWLLVSVLQCN